MKPLSEKKTAEPIQGHTKHVTNIHTQKNPATKFSNKKGILYSPLGMEQKTTLLPQLAWRWPCHPLGGKKKHFLFFMKLS